MRKFHGMANTHIYAVWMNMKARCNNPNGKDYRYYGGRGIRVCDEWGDFVNFKKWADENGYDQSLEIDRKDNNGDYSPANCRFITHAINSRNRSRGRQWIIDGVRFETCLDASQAFGVCAATILNWCVGNKQVGGAPRKGCSAVRNG
jgi:hypothetical protein